MKFLGVELEATVLKLKNAAGTIVNTFANTTTAARTWTLPDKSGTIALEDDTAWTSWTPTFQGLSVGNGALDCAYKQIGKTLHCRIMFTLGSTSTVTGGGAGVLYCNLPNGNYVKSSYSTHHPLGLAVLRDSSSGTSVAGTVSIRNQVAGNVDSVKINYTSSSAGLTIPTNNIASTLPFTWAVNDVIQCSFKVEVE